MTTNEDAANETPGLAKYLQRVARTTIGGIFITGLSACASRHYILVDGRSDRSFLGKLMLVGIVGTVGSILVVCWSKPQVHRNNAGELIEYNTPNRKIASVTQAVSQGVLLGPSFVLYPTLVLPAAACAGAVMAGMISYAMSAEKRELSKWGDSLHTGSWCLFGVGILGSIFGQNTELGRHLDLAECATGIALFAAYVGYDLDQAVVEYQCGKPDSLLRATNMYLDFMNMFVRFMKLMEKNEEKKRGKPE